MKSIRNFLLIGLLGALIFSFIIIFLFNRAVTLEEIGELYDTQLAQTSRILQGFVDRPASEVDFDRLNNALRTATQNYAENEMRNDEGHQYEHKFAIQILDSDYNLLVKSPGAPLYALSPLKDGYSTKQYNNFDWQVFTHHLDSSGYWIIVAERDDVRGDMIHKIELTALTGPFIVMILLAIVLIVIVFRGLKPLNLLSQQIEARNIDKLEPLELINTPAELTPLMNAINFLMQKVSSEVDRERQFLGDIAHELRTPLASLKLNAQNGLQTKDKAQIQQLLIKIVRGVDRSSRLIEQLLTIARLDPRALGEPEVCSLGDIVSEVISQHTQQYSSAKHVNFNVSRSLVDIRVSAYPVLINVLIRNLIDNAYRYSTDNGTINISVEKKASNSFVLIVKDQGPGVSELQLKSLGKRFYRDQPSDRMGTGLGLSIVARIAELHSAKLSFANNVFPDHGLIVLVEFQSELC